VAEARSKSLQTPDDHLEFPGLVEDVVELGDLTVGRVVQDPGWRWSTHMRPIVGGEWCQARHVGIVLSGRFGVLLHSGTTVEFGPDDVYEIPPGHDGYTIGHEPCVLLEWGGLRTFAGLRGSVRGRVLATLLFTDLVDSTGVAARLGDVAWREALSAHFESAREELERFGGREVKTTGDGLLARFEGPAPALHCAAAVCGIAGRAGLQVRAGVHVGEVEVVGNDMRGVAVHAAARIMAAAGPNEILVSETTRALAAGLGFDDRGVHQLRGLPGDWHLFAYIADAEPSG
jgi:class 3 adenylate cyclase